MIILNRVNMEPVKMNQLDRKVSSIIKFEMLLHLTKEYCQLS